ncbi:LLM class flavin-dependent oxidoreductase [Tengunoibacter tsumagoiensis]|uniref:Luciferase-like protein n=1 Tax=Tengunoibacter tsumagoiensis TaxID=2014871 RepID=A0A402A7P2_9CHLR|nr:LLM class flavin-dependent oxidoreductase [Tengunoibacter tsumagoiensis]GCE15016.1 luciferase-like protein [Tengunoibacter tsumagoiensis]
MKYGFVLLGTLQEKIEMAQEAEAAGWDSVFVTDEWGSSWVTLTAIAAHTQHIRLGTMVTALPLHHPWTVAFETAALDHFSQGRVILAVGLGVIELDQTGVVKDYGIRARMLDEGLTIINGLWSGEPFTFSAEHYHLEEMTGLKPLQLPRIPTWVVGGKKPSQLRRATHADGAMVQGTPDEIGQWKALVENQRLSPMPFDIITEAETPGDDPERAAAIIAPYAKAGVTWWIESVWNRDAIAQRQRLRQGPSRLS